MDVAAGANTIHSAGTGTNHSVIFRSCLNLATGSPVWARDCAVVGLVALVVVLPADVRGRFGSSSKSGTFGIIQRQVGNEETG